MPLFAAQCKKGETHKLATIGGYAVDVASGDTLSNVKVRLRRRDRIIPGTSYALQAFETLLDSTTTDANGFFSFTLKIEIDKPYGFEPIKEGFWWNPYMNLTTVHSESNVNNIVQLTPLTFPKVNVKNDIPINSSDSVYYSGPSDRSRIYIDNWWNSNSYKHVFSLKGTQADTTFFVTLLYYEAPLQYWDVTKNGTTIRNVAYIGCDPLDTSFFQIKY